MGDSFERDKPGLGGSGSTHSSCTNDKFIEG
jgi:hypothetical protein